MSDMHSRIQNLQELVTDVAKVDRHHFIPGTLRHENVVEHSFSVTVLCWKLFEETKPPLDLARIMKYALCHDFAERGLTVDTNTFASAADRKKKEEREKEEFKKLAREFKDFDDLIAIMRAYEKRADPEALFVWTVDKLSQFILGEIDAWRPYQKSGITYRQFCDKYEEILSKCSPYLKDIFRESYEKARETYYDK